MTMENMQQVSSFMQQEQQLSRVVLFSDKAVAPSLLKALSSYFAGEVLFGFVPNAKANVEVSKSFQVDTYPTFIIVQGPLAIDKG
jgi:hypothetical protein